MQFMVALFTTLVRLLRAVAGAWRRDPQFRVLVGLVVFLLLSGTVFYSLHEGWSIVDAIYFSAPLQDAILSWPTALLIYTY
jgi:hypothetical protein